MRRYGFSRARGFTLLELSLAMAVAGILVALLVAVWLQASRAGARSAQEAAEDRAALDLTRTLQTLVEGAQWSISSHLPQGALRWEIAPGAFTLWSKAASGLAGPGRWQLRVQGNVLEATVEDAQGAGIVQRRWDGVADVQIEVAQRRVEGTGEQLEWVTTDRWEPALPFRPVAVRITWLTPQGQTRWVTSWL